MVIMLVRILLFFKLFYNYFVILIYFEYELGPSGTSGTFSGKNHDKHIRYNDIQESK